MKKLAEMTIDEAIADTVREVPECASDVVVERLYDCDDPVVVPENEGVLTRALWFHAAYVWLGAQPSIQDGNGGSYLPHRDIRSGQWRDGQYDEDLPTEFHALAAACRLAAGKEVP